MGYRFVTRQALPRNTTGHKHMGAHIKTQDVLTRLPPSDLAPEPALPSKA